jgi:hypothetical protein
VATGPAPGGGRRWRDWFGRVLAPEYRDPEPGAAPAAGAAPSPSEGGDDAASQASLDQVLRKAAGARGAPPGGSG